MDVEFKSYVTKVCTYTDNLGFVIDVCSKPLLLSSETFVLTLLMLHCP